MRPHHGVRMLAALVTAAGALAPTASAKFDNVTYPPLNPRAIVSQHQSGGSSDGEWIALGAAGGLVLTGVTVTARRASRKPATSGRAGVASGS